MAQGRRVQAVFSEEADKGRSMIAEHTKIIAMAHAPKGLFETKLKSRFRWEIIGGICMLNGYRNGAELGVSKGRFTTFLCSSMFDMRMLCVDLWAPQPDNLGEGAETYSTWDHEQSYREFKVLRDKWFSNRVTIWRRHSVEAAKDVTDGSLDFVFIDADHSYKGCKADIEAWEPKVRVGGMVSGHDYDPIKWPGVVKAVDEIYPGASKLPDMTWAHFKKEQKQ
jgi:hypothetical protein